MVTAQKGFSGALQAFSGVLYISAIFLTLPPEAAQAKKDRIDMQ
jgi:hypothetical protein